MRRSGVILVWGPAEDPPLECVASELEQRGAPFVRLLDSELAKLEYDFDLTSCRGYLRVAGQKIPLAGITGMYLRPGHVRDVNATNATSSLLALAARLRATVVNRPAAGGSNLSKMFQARLIACSGLDVPDTLATTDPACARAFLERHGRIVYKSLSGVRSIVSTLDPSDSERLAGVASGPVLLQQWIGGRDVRVHVVGSRWFATVIDCVADDYRYAARANEAVQMAPTDIPPALGDRLVAVTRAMGLAISGIDLRVTSEGRWYCFEVNPSPGFTYYQDHTEQPIAAAVAALLMGDPATAASGAVSRKPSRPPRSARPRT